MRPNADLNSSRSDSKLDVDVLLLDLLELGLHEDGVLGGVAQQSDDGEEELRPDDEHLRVLVRHVRDARVQLGVLLEHRHENGVLAALVVAVLVELREEVGVLLLGR